MVLARLPYQAGPCVHRRDRRSHAPPGPILSLPRSHFPGRTKALRVAWPRLRTSRSRSIDMRDDDDARSVTARHAANGARKRRHAPSTPRHTSSTDRHASLHELGLE
uniref:Predicted protein n=1 Tax=Hordeum vulgare subsp. vulgare TaxID=112509 RepID=F2DYX2_HORVV|nr:predicted protein [Hordeum vulgare subsp. vulgare]